MVFSEKMTESVDRQFTDELLDALTEVDSNAVTVDASEAEVVLSHPMPSEQRARLERLLKESFGADVTVSEKINPDLIAGMILKLGSLEIDGSLRNRYREAAAEQKKSIAH